MSEFAKLMRLASEHTARVEASLKAKKPRSTAPTATPKRTTTTPSRLDERAYRDAEQRVNRLVQATSSELSRLQRPVPTERSRPATSGTTSSLKRKVPVVSGSHASASSSSMVNTPDKRLRPAVTTRGTSGGVTPSRASPMRTKKLSEPRTYSAQPTRSRTSIGKLSYSQLLDMADTSVPKTLSPSATAATKPVGRPLSNQSTLSPRTTPASHRNNGLVPQSHTDPVRRMTSRPGQPPSRTARTSIVTPPAKSLMLRNSPSMSNFPTRKRTLGPAPTELIPLNKTKRDRRSIEEVQADLREKRLAKLDRPLSSPATRIRETVTPRITSGKQPASSRTRPHTSPLGSPPTRAKFAGKKPPSRLPDPDVETRAPQKRPPTLARRPSPGSASNDPRGGDRVLPLASRSRARTVRPLNTTSFSSSTTTTSARSTVSQKKPPSEAQYGSKRPPVATTTQARSRAPLPRPTYPGRRKLRYEEDDDEEVDSDLEDFIVDDEDEVEELDDRYTRRPTGLAKKDRSKEELSSVLKDVFGYDKRRFANQPDYDSDDMEVSAHSLRMEEACSARIARLEDEREEELERLALERKKLRRK
ncbi:Protein SPT2 [Dispira simplex]|nr:Protein SPT2 [Dispira simplex]